MKLQINGETREVEGASNVTELVEALGLPADERADRFDFAFLARCVGLGDRAAVLQLTDSDDMATSRIVTGRPGVMIKRFQLAAITHGVGAERRMPGAIRWSKARRDAARGAVAVAG